MWASDKVKFCYLSVKVSKSLLSDTKLDERCNALKSLASFSSCQITPPPLNPRGLHFLPTCQFSCLLLCFCQKVSWKFCFPAILKAFRHLFKPLLQLAGLTCVRQLPFYYKRLPLWYFLKIVNRLCSDMCRLVTTFCQCLGHCFLLAIVILRCVQKDLKKKHFS